MFQEVFLHIYQLSLNVQGKHMPTVQFDFIDWLPKACSKEVGKLVWCIYIYLQ